MPIKKGEWDRGRKWNTTEEKVLTFLRKNKDTAFTSSEVYSGIYRASGHGFLSLIGAIVTSMSVDDALNTLIKEGTVKAKIVQGTVGEETYYLAR